MIETWRVVRVSCDGPRCASRSYHLIRSNDPKGRLGAIVEAALKFMRERWQIGERFVPLEREGMPAKGRDLCPRCRETVEGPRTATT